MNNNMRRKQAAKIYLKYLLEQVLIDLGSDNINADFKRFVKNINRSDNTDQL